jgi:hypothetical protein
MLLRSPPRPARAVPGVSEAASASLPVSETYRRIATGVAALHRVDEGEMFSDC